MKKEICVYDLNIPSGFTPCYFDLKENGANLRSVPSLEYAKTSCVIINPLSIAEEKHWEEVKKYVKENKDKKIIFFAPSLYCKELENLIGKQENVEYLFTHDDYYHKDINKEKKILDFILEDAE